MSNYYTLFVTPRAVIVRPKDGTEPWARVATTAVTTNGDELITIDYLGGNEPTITINGDLTVNKNTGIIIFSDLDNDYYIRPLRSEDGQWLSKYKISLPVEALLQNIDQTKRTNAMAIFPNGNQGAPQEETLTAVSYPDSNNVIVGLVYNNEIGRWTRIDGDWFLLNDLDESLVESDAIGTMIDPEKADEFIKVFDEEYLTLDEIQEYALKFEFEDEEAPTEQ